LLVRVHRYYELKFFKGWGLHDFVGCCMIFVLAKLFW